MEQAADVTYAICSVRFLLTKRASAATNCCQVRCYHVLELQLLSMLSLSEVTVIAVQACTGFPLLHHMYKEQRPPLHVRSIKERLAQVAHASLGGNSNFRSGLQGPPLQQAIRDGELRRRRATHDQHGCKTAWALRCLREDDLERTSYTKSPAPSKRNKQSWFPYKPTLVTPAAAVRDLEAGGACELQGHLASSSSPKV